ncbi:hypothetical protein ACQ4PT_034147 [Festuca glaucescens]
MEMAAGVASWLVGKLLDKLSNDLVAAYVSSEELGLNSEQIKEDLLYMQALLHAAQGRDDNNPGLKGLLQQLARKADEAEDALDELHYFMIQDKLDNTHHVTPLLAGDIQEKVQHGRKAVRHTFGNWLSNLSCSSRKDDVCAAATAVTDNPQSSAKFDSANVSGHEDHLEFDTVVMSNKIKSVIEVIHSKCLHVSDLLKIPNDSSTEGTLVTIERPVMGSTTEQNKLYGRSIIFEKTIKYITGGAYYSEPLYVLPIVGPGGIGKTTFTQHLYTDKRTQEHFYVRVWVRVSTDFDVLKLTQQINNCIPASKSEYYRDRRGQLIATDVVDGLQPHDNLKELVIKDCISGDVSLVFSFFDIHHPNSAEQFTANREFISWHLELGCIGLFQWSQRLELCNFCMHCFSGVLDNMLTCATHCLALLLIWQLE